MRRRHPNVPVRGPPDPVLVHFSGSDASIAPVTYVVCLRGRFALNFDDDDSDESDDKGSGSGFTPGSLFLLRFELSIG